MRKVRLIIILIIIAVITVLTLIWFLWPRVHLPEKQDLISIKIWTDKDDGTPANGLFHEIMGQDLIDYVLDIDGKLFRIRRPDSAKILLGERPSGVFIEIIYKDGSSFQISADPRYTGNFVLVINGDDSFLCKFATDTMYKDFYDMMYNLF